MTPLLLLGDSHCRAIVAAAQEARFPLVGGMIGIAKLFTHGLFDRFEPVLRDGGLNPEAAAALPRLMRTFAERMGPTDLDAFRGRCVISIGMGSVHLVNSQDWRRYDFGEAANPRKHFISRAVLEIIASELNGPSVEFVDRMASRGLLLAAAAGPPPMASQRAVRHIGLAKVNQLADLYEAPTRAILAKHGVPLIAAEGVTDPQGLLLPEFSAGDNVHGNAAYGARLLQRIIDQLPQEERDAIRDGMKRAA